MYLFVFLNSTNRLTVQEQLALCCIIGGILLIFLVISIVKHKP